MKAGGTLDIDLNATKGPLALKLGDSNGSATYNLDATRIDNSGTFNLTHRGIKLNSGDTDYIDYGTWTGGNNSLDMQVDQDSDGTIDQTVSFDIGNSPPTLTHEANEEATETPDENAEETPTPGRECRRNRNT